MRYTYVTAWSVVGGISLQEEVQERELFRTDSVRFVITRNPDPLLSTIDKGLAIGLLLFRNIFGQPEAGDLGAAIDPTIEEIKAERSRKIGNNSVLVAEFYGDIEVTMDKPGREIAGTTVTYDVIDKQALRRVHRLDIETIKVALGFEGKFTSKFTSLSDGIFLSDSGGKIIYSFAFSLGRPDLITSSQLSTESAERIAYRFESLRQFEDLARVNRLISQLADVESDNLKAFISGWAALEILVEKLFKHYEEEFLSPITGAGRSSLRERFLNRLMTVMKDKYRLAEKFIVVAATLFPEASDEAAIADLKDFSTLNESRNSIYHGKDFSEQDLPLHTLTALLKKYLLAYIEAPRSPTGAVTQQLKRT